MKWTLALIVVAVVAGFGAARLYGEESAAATPQAKLIDAELATSLAILKAANGEKDASYAARISDLNDLLASGVKDPAMLKAITDRTLLHLEDAKATSSSAPQVSQIANQQVVWLALVQVHQNQRIIELLEQLSKKGANGGK